jgi:hypothetical protein
MSFVETDAGKVTFVIDNVGCRLLSAEDLYSGRTEVTDTHE